MVRRGMSRHRPQDLTSEAIWEGWWVGTCAPNQHSATYHAQRLKHVLAHGTLGLLFKSSARAADSPVCRNLWCSVHEGAILKVTWENGIAWAIQEEVSKEDIWMHPCVIKKKKKKEIKLNNCLRNAWTLWFCRKKRKKKGFLSSG